jgi:acrylyl-CoA reductase (NADPH)
LAASEIIERKELAGPAKSLGKERWAGDRRDHARQYALDDALRRVGGRLWTGGRHRFADFGRAVYPAWCFASRHRLRHASDGRSANGVTTVGERLDWGKLAAMTSEIGLAEVIEAARNIVEGRVRGRIVVNIG